MPKLSPSIKALLARIATDRQKSLVDRALRAIEHRGVRGVFAWTWAIVKHRLVRPLVYWVYRGIRPLITCLRHILFRAHIRFFPSEISQKDIKNTRFKLFEKVVCESFCSKYYIEQHGLSVSEFGWGAFTSYLREGIAQGYSPNPMFDNDYVSQQCHQSEPVTFASWVLDLDNTDYSPSLLFDPNWYKANTQVEMSNLLDGWLDFVCRGVWLDRSPNRFFEPRWYTNHCPNISSRLPYFYDYLLNNPKLPPNPDFPQPTFNSEDGTKSGLYLVLSDLRQRNPDYSYDDFENVCGDTLYYKRAELDHNFVGQKFDSIVLIPRCGIGGAAVVAGRLCSALTNMVGEDEVLVVLTDDSLFMRPDWFSDAASVFDLSKFNSGLVLEEQYRLLKYLLGIVSAKRVFNVNSRLMWDALLEHGDDFSSTFEIYAYCFCYEVSHTNQRTGYPVSHVPECLKYLTKLFVDNTFLAQDLITQNSLSEPDRSKIIVLKTPYKSFELLNDSSDLEFGWKPPKAYEARRVKVFWAGRFDRQKRLDIVADLAFRNPSWDFWIWGKAMVGAEPDKTKMPANMKFHGLYESMSDLPLHECDVWLYTSQWDGIPTLLIELGLREMPIVSSRVWGLADLVTDETAWPVDDIEDVSEYQRGIRYFINNQNIARERGIEMKKKIVIEHSSLEYASSLSLALAGRG